MHLSQVLHSLSYHRPLPQGIYGTFRCEKSVSEAPGSGGPRQENPDAKTCPAWSEAVPRWGEGRTEFYRWLSGAFGTNPISRR